jgi:hypothetical protein
MSEFVSKVKNFAIKLIALQDSINIVKSAITCAINRISFGVFVGGYSNVVNMAVKDAFGRLLWSSAGKNTRTKTRVSVYSAANRGEDIEEITNFACSSIMDNYNEILTVTRSSEPEISPNKNVDWDKIARYLIDIDDTMMEKMCLSNRRFRFFYFFLVHELFSLLPSDNEMVLKEFSQFLKKIGDLESYNNLFLGNISLNSSTIDIPLDLIKIIIDYTRLSIYNPDDVGIIFNKLIEGTIIPF